MLRNKTIASVCLFVSFLMISRLQAQSREGHESLLTLTWKTGWIHLGDITADGKRWAIGSDPYSGFITGRYEIIGSRWDRRSPRLPRIGARIRLTVPDPVMILDYATTGERRRMDPVLDRPLRVGDETGITLPAGTVLEVRSVKVSKAYGDYRGIWARVVPVSR